MKSLFLGNKKYILGLLAFLIVSFAFLSNASAAYPSIVSYQGYLTSATGTPQTGTSTVTVRIYDSSTGGTLLYEEVHPSTSISSGTFNVSIGSVGDVNVTTSAAAISDLSFSQRYFITIEIASPYSTGEMTLGGGVRAELAAAPFSITTGGVAAIATSSGLSALAGKLYFNTTDNLLYVHNGTTWNPLSTASSGLVSLNGLTGVSQTFAAGTSGTDFNISSGGSIHTFNVPNAGASSRGLISTTTQTIAGDKTFSGTTLLATTTVSKITASGDIVASSTLSVTGASTFYGILTTLGNIITNTVLASSSVFTNASTTNLSLSGRLYDSANATGTLGQVLWSTGTSTLWVSTSSLGITGGSGVSGGTNGFLARFTGATTLSTGLFLDNGTVAGVNATSSTITFNVQGTSGVNPFSIASSTGSTLFSVIQNGNVGIGTSSPSSKLTVDGDIRIATGSGGQIIFADGSTMSSAALGSASSLSAVGDAIVTGDSNADASGNIIFKTGSNDRVTILNNGNVGIGSTSPAYMLGVTGTLGVTGQATFNTGSSSVFTATSLFSSSANLGSFIGTTGNLSSTLDVTGKSTLSNASATALTVSQSLYSLGVSSLATTTISSLTVTGTLKDSSSNSGTLGQLLWSTGTSTLWVSTSSLGITGGGGSSPAGSSGQIQFNDGGSFGGASALAYDSTNGRLGIGTSSPKFRLDIQGTTTTPSIGVTELISLAADRDFSSNTGNWTGGFTISGGTLNYPSGLFDSESLSTSVFTPTVGATYQITFDMTTTSTSMDGLRVRLGDNHSQYIGTTVGSESVTLYIKAESTSGFVFDNTGWHGTIDNISLKLVSGGEAVMALRAASGVSVLEFRTGGLVSSSGDYSYENTFIGKESGRVTDNSGTWNVGFGAFSLSSNTTGDANTSVGSGALTANTTGGYNTAVGFRSLFRNTTGNLNVANGYMTLYSNTTGYDNVAVGDQALKNNTTGTYNIGIGTNALQYATSSSQLVAIGYNALQNNSQGGADNIAIGTNALQTNTIGDGNLAIGVAALQDNTTGNYNVAFGTSALSNNSTGTDNTAIGNSALIFSQTGSSNVAVGSQSLFGLSSGSTNVALGVNTLFNNVSGSRNTAVGHAAGSYISTGSGNLVIGYGADVSSSTGSNQLSIGNLIYGTGLDGTGTSTISSGNIGIGTSTPGSRLDVYKNTGSSNVDIFRLISDVGGASNVKFRVDSDGDVFTDGGTTINSGADVAENYTASEPLEKGDVVALSFTTEEWKTRDPGGDEDAYQISTVRKASNKDKAFGVISTNPGLTLGGNTTNAVPVALSGRIPVKVTLENGDIKAGDLLTVSSLEKGYAAKLSGSGQSIGRALSDFGSSSGKSTSTVIVFIENKDHHETLREEDGLSELALATSTATSTNLLSSISQIKDALKTNFTVLKSFVTIKLTAAVAYVDTLFTRELHAETVCLKKSDGGEVCINGDQIESILGTTTEAVLPLLTPSPSVTTDSGDTPNPPQASSTEEVSSSTEIALPDPAPVITEPTVIEPAEVSVIDNQNTTAPEQPIQ